MDNTDNGILSLVRSLPDAAASRFVQLVLADDYVGALVHLRAHNVDRQLIERFLHLSALPRLVALLDEYGHEQLATALSIAMPSAMCIDFSEHGLFVDGKRKNDADVAQIAESVSRYLVAKKSSTRATAAA